MTQVLRSGASLQLVRFEMRLDEFPECLRNGIGNDGRLAATEKLAQDVIACEFLPDACIKFVKAVCLWGSDPRRAGKVIKRNSPDRISAAFKSAHALTTRGSIVDALKAVASLEGLAVSFGSKHLKFLDPDQHVVLDSILSDRLGYKRDMEGEGYAHWLEACHEYLRLVSSARVAYPGTGRNGWRVSDIEMAIFNRIRSE